MAIPEFVWRSNLLIRSLHAKIIAFRLIVVYTCIFNNYIRWICIETEQNLPLGWMQTITELSMIFVRLRQSAQDVQVWSVSIIMMFALSSWWHLILPIVKVCVCSARALYYPCRLLKFNNVRYHCISSTI